MKPQRSFHLYFGLIVAIYLAIGVLYAVYTPVWQVPDEPAHYNYVRSLAEGRGFPVLEVGDYNQHLLNELTARAFPPELSVSSLEYEDHQPPLYYLLATPVYWAFGGAIVPLRFFSVLLGALALWIALRVVCQVFPSRMSLALLSTMLIAFIPQRIAITAGVNNDVLAEVVLGAVLWAVVRYVDQRRMPSWAIGALLGVVLLTKTTAYVGLGVALLGVVFRTVCERRSWQWTVSQLAQMVFPALVISLPWFVRNAMIYGWSDPLGLKRHNMVVVGQPLSAEWLEQYGWDGLLSRLVRTTFQSFWGQFGWMGVVLPAHLYLGLGLFSTFLFVGFVWWCLDAHSRTALSTVQRIALVLLFASSVMTVCAFLWYNLTFVQHQGRYLFPALIPWGLAGALGLGQWALLMPRPFRFWAGLALGIGLVILDLVCLFRFVIPALVR